MCLPLWMQRMLAPDLDKRIYELTELIKDEEEPQPKPEWMNNDSVYMPKVSIEGNSSVELPDPREIYTVSNNLISFAYDWIPLPLDEKLIGIWNYVIANVTYKFDASEHWQYPQTTFYRKQGDCEDGTILFVTLCLLADVPADGVFNACGWFYKDGDKFGHSFPIAKMSDGEWYVFESTLDSSQTTPLKLEGSQYDCSWGLSNWLYKGKIKSEFNVGGDKWQI